ncbi:hypothetical protein [Frigoribacterium sp. VKM Ac-2530]|uniref:hypothetical protein n=1 Tax=Frigoribacterium sp. VKM Ac-2530 TaxID=2783822 RepID=UPI00188B8474|nr:hypothetical protein [Frigoribacterium sp. VKM Ac-2530]MBF4578944.1 hypothetical protein [Frigoribacterium sp. VKM Ac-2530]
MKSRAERLAEFEAREAVRKVKRAEQLEREAARRGELDERRADLARRRAALKAGPDMSKWNAMSEEERDAIRKRSLAASEAVSFGGAVSESALGGLLFPWQVRSARRQEKAQRLLREDDE